MAYLCVYTKKKWLDTVLYQTYRSLIEAQVGYKPIVKKYMQSLKGVRL